MKTIRLVSVCVLSLLLGCAGSSVDDDEAALQSLTPLPLASTAVPVIAFTDTQGILHVRSLAPGQLSCLTHSGEIGCPVARLYFANANVTYAQQVEANSRATTSSSDFGRATMLLDGWLMQVTVRDHRTGTTRQETWFNVTALYFAYDLRVHSPGFFDLYGDNGLVALAMSQGAQTAVPATLSWAPGFPAPTGWFRNMIVTGQADFSQSPLPIVADQYFIYQHQ